jgi:hypothetical protein
MASKTPISLMILVTLIAVPGCGSDEPSQVPAMSKAQFARQADLICTDAANDQGKLATEYLERHPNTEEADLVEPALIPPLTKALEELRELGMPSGAAAQGEAFISHFEAALKAVEQEPAAALSGKDNPFVKTNALARRLKLGDCSRNP